jgi:hypothetical protein
MVHGNGWSEFQSWGVGVWYLVKVERLKKHYNPLQILGT